MTLLERLFPRRIRLTYGLTVCHEADELERLLKVLLPHCAATDELLVLQDITRPDARVGAVLDRYRHRIRVRQARLAGDFATFKNQLIAHASGTYLFQIDADEVPAETLLRTLKKTLVRYRKADCFALPRVNRVEGLTPDWVARWNWTLDAAGRVNFPDYQLRLFRLNRGIHWKNRVHEELTGFERCQYLPADDETFCLYHPKDIERQKRQNALYDSL
jgi:glycosyltransferase involved in cell wall biosynthesis